MQEHFPKLIYRAQRHPSLSREAFTPRWRQHGALGMSMPRWVHVLLYGHCDVIHPKEPVGGIATDADGIGLIWYKNAEARARNIGDTASRQTMEEDEDKVFAERVVKCAALTREVVIRPGARTPFKLMSFVKKADGVASERLSGVYAGEYAPERLAEKLLGRRDAIVRHAANYAVRDPQVAAGLDVDVVEEVWFANAEDLAAAGAAFAAVASAASRDWVARRDTYLTNEVILYEAPR